jgi:prepilin-type N-terminal cleavage/methylation domain-containing protein
LRGFTLIEILCVVVILGIASAVVIPNLGMQNDQYCSAAARVVMADLIYAQNQAIVTQSVTYVNFNTTGQTYSLLSVSPSTNPLAYLQNPVALGNYTRTFNSSVQPQLQSTTISSVSFDGNTTLAFDELGQPLSWTAATNSTAPLANSGSIVIQSGTVSITVSIEPYTANLTAQ